MLDAANTKHSRNGQIAVLVLFAVLVLYPLSVGPASWLTEHEYLNLDLATQIYMPVLWVGRRFPVAGEALSWYQGLWR